MREWLIWPYNALFERSNLTMIDVHESNLSCEVDRSAEFWGRIRRKRVGRRFLMLAWYRRQNGCTISSEARGGR